MTWLDILLLAAVGIALFFALRSTVRSFKRGKCPGCGEGGCGGACTACRQKCDKCK